MPIRRAARTAAIALTYEGGGTEYLDRVLPLLDYLEVNPDGIAASGDVGVALPEHTLATLEALARDVGIVVHGVGLSIGSADRWSEQYLRLLDQIVERIPVAWHSEHLGYVNVDGQHLGTMLPLPLTEEALDLV